MRTKILTLTATTLGALLLGGAPDGVVCAVTCPPPPVNGPVCILTCPPPPLASGPVCILICPPPPAALATSGRDS